MTQFVEHTGWMFEHTAAHDPQLLSPPDLTPSHETISTAPSNAVHSAVQTLWHQSDMNSGPAASSGQLDQVLATSVHALLHPLVSGGTGTSAAPSLTVANNAVTVAEGGSIPLQIGVTPAHAGDNVSVTIKGLTSTETVTDALDHQVFSGSSITLSAAQVNSGLALTSSYSGSGHPVNTLAMTANDRSRLKRGNCVKLRRSAKPAA